MKKTILCLTMAVIMLVAMVSVSAADYEAADYSIPFDKVYGGANETTISTTTFDGKNVISVKKGTASDVSPQVTIGESAPNGWGQPGGISNPLSVRFGDYKYLVVKAYWALDTVGLGTNHRVRMQLKQVSYNDTTTNPWTTYVAQTNAMSDDLSQFGIIQDYWCYLIFELEEPYIDSTTTPEEIDAHFSDTTKWLGGNDSTVELIQFYPFAHGGCKNSDMSDTDVCYLQFLTFTNDYDTLIKADMAADAAGGNNGSDNSDGDSTGGNDEGSSTETRAPETSATPETTAAPETTVATEEKSGCGSTVGFAVLPVALMAGGMCVAKRKKKDD